jgi:hypothetical protein
MVSTMLAHNAHCSTQNLWRWVYVQAEGMALMGLFSWVFFFFPVPFIIAPKP